MSLYTVCFYGVADPRKSVQDVFSFKENVRLESGDMVPKFSTFTGYLARLLPRVRNALPSTYCFQVLKRWIGAGPKISSLNGCKFLPCVHWRLVGASICSGQSKTGVDIGYEVMARNGETVVLIIACRGLILRFTSCNRAPFSSMVQTYILCRRCFDGRPYSISISIELIPENPLH